MKRPLVPSFHRLWPFAVASVLLTGIVHILIVFAMPTVAEAPATSRLAHAGSLNRLAPVAESSAAAAAMPFADPALETAACPFDLSESSLKIQVPTGDHFLSVLLVADGGRIPVAFTDRAATRRMLEIHVMTAEQRRAIEAADGDDEQRQEIRITFPTERGVAVFRTLPPSQAARAEARAQLSRIVCGTAEAL